MSEQTLVDNQLQLLAITRRRLGHLLRQQARLGDYTPPHVSIDIEDAQTTIQQLKQTLRSAGVDIPESPEDEAQIQASVPGASRQDQRNRRRLIQKVYDFWIKGVLEHSLHGAALISLGLEMHPSAVAHAWDTIVQREHNQYLLPSDEPVINIFDQNGEELLILGAPGSGKTTLLLELTRDLTVRARSDPSYPIPVLFNLSSWAEHRLPIDQWLIDELNRRYDVPRKIATTWIVTDQILPLLDGLDEVQHQWRSICVDAINRFRREHGLVSLVVCSRIADYEALKHRLKLQSAVIIQPLTSQQIDAYLNGFGSQLAGLRAALADDALLREMAEAPVMLSVMALAYSGQPVEMPMPAETLEERRRRLLDMYVQQMVHHRNLATFYSTRNVLEWMAWLARGMVHHGHTIFFIEDLQPDWLDTADQHWQYELTKWLVALGLGIVLGWLGVAPIVFMTEAGFAVSIWFGIGLFFGLSFGIVGGIIVVLVLRLMFDRLNSGQTHVTTTPGVRYIFIVLATLCVGALTLSKGLIGSVVVTLMFGWLLWWLERFVERLLKEYGLRTVRSPTTRQGAIAIIETIRWSWSRSLAGSLLGLAIGGILFGAIAWIIYGWLTALIMGGLSGVFFALFGALVGGLTGGELDLRSIPNQGIWRSARSAATSALIFGLGGGLGVGLFFGIVFGGFAEYVIGEAPDRYFVVGASLGGFLAFGGSVAIGAAVTYGGFACLLHFALRLTLWRHNAMPWNYARFLDSAATAILLRKAGGGYLFVHRMLMEYFAEQSTLWVHRLVPLQTRIYDRLPDVGNDDILKELLAPPEIQGVGPRTHQDDPQEKNILRQLLDLDN